MTALFRFASAIILLGITLNFSSALEVTGEEDWLNRPHRLNAADRSLGSVLDELIAVHGALKLNISTLFKPALTQSLTVIDQRPDARIRDHLRHIEWLTDTTIVVRPGSLSLTRDSNTWQDLIQLRRYNVNDLLSPILDFRATPLGLQTDAEAGMDFDLFCGGKNSGLVEGWDIGMLEETITSLIAPHSWEEVDVALDVRQGATLFINQRPDVHRQIETYLEQLRQQYQSSYNVRVMVVQINENQPLYSGLHSERLLSTLDQHKRVADFHISGINGQQNQQSQIQQRRFTSKAATNATGRLIATQGTLSSGFSANARLIRNDLGHYLQYQLNALDDLGNRRSVTFKEPTRQGLSHLPSSGKDNKTGKETETQQPAPLVLNIPADEVTIDLPSYYSWQSQGSALIPHGQVLVEIQRDAQGRRLALIWHPQSSAQDSALFQPISTISNPKTDPLTLIQAQAAANGKGLVINIAAQRKLKQVKLDQSTNWPDFLTKLSEHGIWINDSENPWRVSDKWEHIFIQETLNLNDLRFEIEIFQTPSIPIPGFSDIPPLDQEEPPSLDELMEILQIINHPEMWDNDGVGLEEYNGQLVVTGPAFLIRACTDFFNQLHKERLRQIHVELIKLPASPQLSSLLSAQEVDVLRKQHPVISSMLMRNGNRNSRNHTTSHHYLSAIELEGSTRVPQMAIAKAGFSVDVEASTSGTNNLLVTQRFETTRLQPMSEGRGALENVTQRNQGHSTTNRVESGGGIVGHYPDASYVTIFTLMPQLDASTPAKP